MFPISKQTLEDTIRRLGIVKMTSATIRQICALAAALEEEAGERFVHLEIGNPGLPAVMTGVNAEIEALKGGIANKYPDIAGIPRLKKAGSEFVKAFLDIDISPRGIVPTVGSMQGCFTMLLLLGQRVPGKDTMLYINPGFPAQRNQAKILGLKEAAFDNITIGLCGDLKFGRTVHSLINALVRYENVKFILISPEELKLPGYVREDVIKKNGYEYKEVERLEEVMPELDILYMTRVQQERFFNEEDYVRMKDFYILDNAKMSLARPDMLVLHPLPRVNEIAVEVDADPRAVYFKQVQYGVYVRMALILTLLELKG